MSKLKNFFTPSSIAVIGASNRRNSVGMRVFKNLIAGKFKGKVYPVNPKHKKVQGVIAYSSVTDIKPKIDLAVISIPAVVVPKVIAECGAKGILNVIVLSAGFSEIGSAGKEIEAEMLAAARKYKIRIIGPNCLGVMQPYVNMNASFDNDFALPGNLAFVSQSGALASAILDWSLTKDIGFSSLVSLGNCADIDFPDVIDYLREDSKTKSILLYIEGIHTPGRFLDSLRRAAKVKPVIAIKAGRGGQGSRAALSHTGALIGNDDVFAAALRRTGVVRVDTIESLFVAAEMLSSNMRVKGKRLTVITNGGGAGVMAADRAMEVNIELPEVSEKMIAACNKVLPPHWSHHNPVDIIGDADPQRYHDVLQLFDKEKSSNALLALLVPVALVDPLKVAEQIVKDHKKFDKPLLTSWMGDKKVQSARRLFEKNKIPTFDTPEKAVEAFYYLAQYHQNQQLLAKTRNYISYPDNQAAAQQGRKIFRAVLAAGRKVLTTTESKAVLDIFRIPITAVQTAATVEDAVSAANDIGYPIVMKINSPDITHKKDVNGVLLNIETAESVKKGFNKVMQNVRALQPQAKIEGVTIERMINNPNDRELMIGVIQDPVFGPVISCGAGGTFVEIFKDRALALPPLNDDIATHLVTQTKIYKALGKFRNMAPVDLHKLNDVLLRVSNMVCELPEIAEMDINPLIVNDAEVFAVDARIVLTDKPVRPALL